MLALATVAREHSFNRAADELGYVQSAISGQIAQLEKAVGMRLLERSSGTSVVELTDAGRLLLRHVDEILIRYDSAQAAISFSRGRADATVRVAGLEMLGAPRLAKVLSAFRQLRPFARVLIEASAGVEALPASETLDAFLHELQPAVEPGEREIEAGSIEFVLLVPAGSALTRSRQPLGVDELYALRPIVPGLRVCPQALRAQLDELGIQSDKSIVSGSAAIARGLVANHLGTAIVPATWVDPQDHATVGLDLSHVFDPCRIALTLAKPRVELSPAFEVFVDLVRQVLGGNELTRAALTSPARR